MNILNYAAVCRNCAIPRHLEVNSVPHGHMSRFVQLVLCLPGRNAFRSHINYIWSEENSPFYVDTIQAILAVKTDADLRGEAFSN
jgi:hypothetical protein